MKKKLKYTITAPWILGVVVDVIKVPKKRRKGVLQNG